MRTTDVFIVGDLSGSMAGRKDALQRQMVMQMVEEFAAAERTGNQRYNVRILGFANQVYTGNERPASAVTQQLIDGELSNHSGGTALRDAILAALTLSHESKAEAQLVAIFSDGEENASRASGWQVSTKIHDEQLRGTTTITFAGPQSARLYLSGAGIPLDNFKAWDGSEREAVEVSRDTVAATASYVASRSLGEKSTSRFYADANKLTTPGLRGATKKVEPTEVRKVTSRMAGRAIADFYGGKFQPGQHYYELMKPEYIQEDKELVVLVKDQNEYRLGSRAVRTLLGLPEVGKVRVHPGPQSDKFQIFVQSSSVNRKVVEGQTMLTL